MFLLLGFTTLNDYSLRDTVGVQNINHSGDKRVFLIIFATMGAKRVKDHQSHQFKKWSGCVQQKYGPRKPFRGSLVDPGFPSYTAVLVTRKWHFWWGPWRSTRSLLRMRGEHGGTTMSREPLSLFGAKDPVAPILLIIHSPPLAPCGLRPSTPRGDEGCTRDAPCGCSRNFNQWFTMCSDNVWQFLHVTVYPYPFIPYAPIMAESWKFTGEQCSKSLLLNQFEDYLGKIREISEWHRMALSSSIKQLGYLGEIRPLNH